MPKLTAVKIPKVSGDKIIAGYRISLPKVELEKHGFKEGDNLEIKVRKDEIKIRKI